MIATTNDCQILQYRRPKRLYCCFRLSVVVAIARVSFFAVSVVELENPRFTVGISVIYVMHTISTSGLDSHIAISGYPSMTHLFGGTFLEFGVVDNFVYRALLLIHSAV